MPVTVQMGNAHCTLKLIFKQGSTVVAAPAAGGSCSTSNTNVVDTVSMLTTDTVQFNAKAAGQATLNYVGPTGSGITASDIVTVVATIADNAAFDDSSLVVAP